MAELSFLTIIVSLAVCSLLVYGIFQYMKVRLTVLEQSHREQAMILQQYIEESSSDIHRLYQISSERSGYGSDKGQPFPPNGSIILEYQEEQRMNDKPNAYNEPHTIHLDTAFFQNKRTNNLIEISSNSENTTDSEDDDDSDSESSDSESSDSADEVENTEDHAISTSETNNLDDTNEICEIVTDMITNISYDSLSQSTDVKTVTVDLGTTETEQEQDKKQASNSNDLLYAIYKKAQQTPLPEDNDLDNTLQQEQGNHTIPAKSTANTTATPVTPIQTSTPIHVPLSSMSVPDLKQLLKELCKNQPEKHAEIQRLKKPELIYAIKQLQQ
jgi:hypothetical protein